MLQCFKKREIEIDSTLEAEVETYPDALGGKTCDSAILLNNDLKLGYRAIRAERIKCHRNIESFGPFTKT